MSAPSPMTKMTIARAIAWERKATNEEFYKFLKELAQIYAKKNYKDDGKVDDTLLFKDYKKWLDDGKIEASSAHPED